MPHLLSGMVFDHPQLCLFGYGHDRNHIFMSAPTGRDFYFAPDDRMIVKMAGRRALQFKVRSATHLGPWKFLTSSELRKGGRYTEKKNAMDPAAL